MKDYENFDAPKSSKIPLLLLPLATALVSVAVGVAVGWTVRYLTTPEVIVEVPRDYTSEELEQVCKPLILDTAEELDVAQVRVKNLESLVVEKGDQVNALEQEMERRAERGTARFNQLRRELDQARAQLVTLEEQLDSAIEEKRLILVELEVTQEALDDQIVATEIAEAEVIDQRWTTFLRDVQIEICDRGNRKQLGRCRESIDAALKGPSEDRWQTCVASGQAQPVLKEAKNKKEVLPDHAAYINEEDRITKGWYIIWCDPSLPEATDLLDLDEVLSDVPPPPDDMDDIEDEFWDEFAEEDL